METTIFVQITINLSVYANGGGIFNKILSLTLISIQAFTENLGSSDDS